MPSASESPDHALDEKIAEDLELDRESRERRNEERERLIEEVAEGKAIDLAAWETDELPPLDLNLGVVIDTPPDEGVPHG